MRSGLHSHKSVLQPHLLQGATFGSTVAKGILTFTGVRGILWVTTWHAGRELLIVMRERRNYDTIAGLRRLGARLNAPLWSP